MSLLKPTGYDATEIERDIASIPCPHPECLAPMGEPCTCSPLVHFNRRLKRLLIEGRPDLLEEPS